jgi:hypothetical protein
MVDMNWLTAIAQNSLATVTQVYFDANKVIIAVAGEAGFPPVERTVKVKDGAKVPAAAAVAAVRA